MKKQKNQKGASFFDNRRSMLLTLLGIGVIIRILVLVQWNNSVFQYAVWSDAATYNQWARNIVATGDWIGTQPFFMTPFYPYFLAVIYTIAGESLHWVRLVQNAAGLLTVLLIYASAEKMFSRRSAFFAALAATLYGPFYLHANILLVETMKIFFLMLSFYCVLEADGKKSLRWWAYAGISAGAAILCRPTDIFAAAAVLLWMVFVSSQPWIEKRRNGIVFIASVIIIVLPVTIRNYTISHEFIPVTSNGGLNFYLGNNPKADGVYYNVDGLDLANDPDGRIYLETSSGKRFTPGQASAYWMSEGVRYIIHQPADYVVLLGKKLMLFFHHKEISQLGYNYYFISGSAVPVIGLLLTFAVLLPFTCVGWIALRKEWKKYFLLYGFFAAQCMSVVLFFITDRFRLSSIPFMMIFAGYGMEWLWSQWRLRQRSASITGGAALLTALGISVVFALPIEDDFSIEHEYIGMNHFDMKQYELALAEYRKALSYKETFHIRNNIGNVYAAAGNIPEAMKEYRRGTEMNPRQAISFFSMGTAYVRVQQFDSALIYFQKAKQINPRFAPAYLNAGLSFWYTGKYRDALNQLERYLALEPDQSKTITVRRDIENLKQLIAQEQQ